MAHLHLLGNAIHLKKNWTMASQMKTVIELMCFERRYANSVHKLPQVGIHQWW